MIIIASLKYVCSNTKKTNSLTSFSQTSTPVKKITDDRKYSQTSSKNFSLWHISQINPLLLNNNMNGQNTFKNYSNIKTRLIADLDNTFLNNTNNTVTLKNQQLQQTNDQQKVQINPLTKDKEQLQQTNDQQKVQITNLTQDKEQLQQTNKEQEAQITNLTQDKEQLQQTNEQQKVQINQLTKDKEQLQQTNEQQKVQINQLTLEKTHNTILSIKGLQILCIIVLLPTLLIKILLINNVFQKKNSFID